MTSTERKNFSALCKSMINPTVLSCQATNHGIIFEDLARREFAFRFKKKVQRCGFYIDHDFPFLGASPDGFITEENAVIEIKCPYEGRNQKVDVSTTFPYLEKRDGNTCLKLSHAYYYQVQGQINIAKANHAYFIVFTHVDCHVEIIVKDETLYEKVMLPRLIEFYEGFFREEAAFALSNT